MAVEFILRYKREGELSTGTVESKEGEEQKILATFSCLHYDQMLKQLCQALATCPLEADVSITIQRSDRAGLNPFPLDKATVELFRTDPVAAVRIMAQPLRSPSSIEKEVRDESTPIKLGPIRACTDAAAEAFGDNLFFRVRDVSLECPGCGFWGAFTTPGLLHHSSREGIEFKTTYVCRAKCLERFVVTCREKWGYVSTEFLLMDTKLDRFYFPREWNGRRPWILREELQQLSDSYKKEKESTYEHRR